MSIGGGRRVSTRTRVVLAAATLLAATVIAVAPEHGRDVAKATSSCPTGTGYGGNVTTDANSGVSAAGNGCVIIVHSGGTDVFVHTGALQTWTVPAGVTSIELHVIGAGGGGGLQNRGGSLGSIGGGGGYATGTLTVTPGDQYSIIVGKGGRHQCAADLATDDLATRRNFNFGGGAAGYGLNAWDCSWASGGGRSAVRTLTGTDDIITAGGGGGGGYDKGGGAGGGATGVAGTNTGYATGGGGGTQSAGGAGGVGEDGYAGDKYVGGPAGVSWGSPSEGGGGGGGYYGGGGGGNNAGGGGGSSFVGTARGLINGSTTAGSGRVPGAIAPVNSGAPTISGTANVGETLTATTGTWSGATTKSFAWQVSTDGGVTWNNISGATGSTYVVGVSGRIRVVETAQNYFGTTTANSVSTAAIVDTTLSALSVSVGTLDPVFSSGVFAYAVTVPYTTTSVTVTPTRTHSSTTITVNAVAVTSGVASGSISLSIGSNTVTIVATNTGISATTTVTITREAATAPGAPTITTVTGGQGRLTVAFTAPASDGGEPITDYEYSRNSGTWTSVGATTSPFVITGLSDNTSYSIRLRARNTVGAGSASTAQSGTTSVATTTTSTTSTTTTTTTTVASTTSTTPSTTTTTAVPAVTTSLDPTATTVPPPPVAALVQATTPTFAPGALRTRVTTTTVSGAAGRTVGARPTATTAAPVATTSSTTVPPAPDTGGDGVALVVDGQELPIDIEKKDGVVTTSSGSLRASIAGVTSDGSIAPLDSEGNVRVGNKGRIRVGVEGFQPGSYVEVWLYSTPTRLGAVAVGGGGTARGDLAIPSSVKDGLHRAVLRGTSDRGAAVQVALSVVVGEPGRISPAGRAILVVALVIAALSALFLPAVLRRRRDEEDEADLRSADVTS